MRNIPIYTAVRAAILSTSVLILTTSLFAQADAKNEKSVNASATVNTQTVNAQQAGTWTIGIRQAKNTVQLTNSQSNPLRRQVTLSGYLEALPTP